VGDVDSARLVVATACTLQVSPCRSFWSYASLSLSLSLSLSVFISVYRCLCLAVSDSLSLSLLGHTCPHELGAQGVRMKKKCIDANNIHLEVQSAVKAGPPPPLCYSWEFLLSDEGTIDINALAME